MKTVSLTTDFGHEDWFVGTMKGIIYRWAPGTPVCDICHEIPPGDVRTGAFVLGQSCRWFPGACVHVGVVDPGVGSSRRPVIISTDGPDFVGPDNGLFSIAIQNWNVTGIHRIENPSWMNAEVSHTFHGRDIFAPAAACLASGRRPGEAGPEITDLRKLSLPEPRISGNTLTGEILYVDRFGNLITNIPTGSDFSAADITSFRVCSLENKFAGIRTCYADIPIGQAALIAGSSGFWEFACNGQPASEHFRAGSGTAFSLTAQ